MVEQVKSILSTGMKALLGLVVIETGVLAYFGKMEGEAVAGIFMALFLLAQNIISKGREDEIKRTSREDKPRPRGRGRAGGPAGGDAGHAPAGDVDGMRDGEATLR
jgi:hypothetical protein